MKKPANRPTARSVRAMASDRSPASPYSASGRRWTCDHRSKDDSEEPHRICAYRVRQRDELDDVDSALSILVFRDERLRLAETIREFLLRQACSVTRLAQRVPSREWLEFEGGVISSL